VFVGGGTPSLLSPAQFKRLVDGLAACCNWQPAEFTVEANPETLDAGKVAAYADCGVNRLSLGLQTHDDAILTRIGRRHTWDTFLRAYELAAKRIPNINVDTIFGLPGQTLEGYAETLRRVTALNPAHVSSYALKLETGTPLAGQFAGADEDLDREMYHAGIALLESAGLKQYETSNFSRPGLECRHNMKYWTGAEYLGLGVAAHSYLHGGAAPVRFGNTRGLDEYMRAVGSGELPATVRETLSASDEMEEYIMLRLRLARGLEFADYAARFGGDFVDGMEDAIRVCENAGLIVRTEAGIAPTARGFDLQNALIGEFLKRL
jgi:oxygen-independent coproporphyrinogen-3 oxidase